MSMQDTVHRRRAHAEAGLSEVVDEFQLRRIGGRAHEVEQLLLTGGVEHTPARHSLRTLIAEPPLPRADDETYDCGDADAEIGGHLSLGTVATGTGFDDLLPQVERVGSRHVVTSGTVPTHTNLERNQPRGRAQ